MADSGALYDHDRSKVSKKSVDYSQGMKERHCGICRHFLPPHACRLVRGKIDDGMWCKKFKAKVAD